MPTITDTRNVTRESLTALHERLAHLSCQIASEEARLDQRIADAKSASLARTKDARAERDLLDAQLSAGILSHPEWFEKPRAIKTPFGAFGLRSVSQKLEVVKGQEEAVIAWARENGYTDLLREKVVLDRDAVKRRIKAGEAVPDCTLPVGETTFWETSEHLLEAARTLADAPIQG